MRGMSSPLWVQIRPWREPSDWSSAQPCPCASSISSLPSQSINVIAVAATVSGAGEAIEGKLAALFAEQDVGIESDSVMAECRHRPLTLTPILSAAWAAEPDCRRPGRG